MVASLLIEVRRNRNRNHGLVLGAMVVAKYYSEFLRNFDSGQQFLMNNNKP